MLTSRAATTMSNPPLENLPNVPNDNEFAIPAPLHDTSHLAPPTITSLGRALSTAAMGSHAFHDGVGHPLSDTPMGSAPSTASNSPRM
jgi:6-phosphofructo-2-kinase